MTASTGLRRRISPGGVSPDDIDHAAGLPNSRQRPAGRTGLRAGRCKSVLPSSLAAVDPRDPLRRTMNVPGTIALLVGPRPRGRPPRHWARAAACRSPSCRSQPESLCSLHQPVRTIPEHLSGYRAWNLSGRDHRTARQTVGEYRLQHHVCRGREDRIRSRSAGLRARVLVLLVLLSGGVVVRL